MTAPTIAKIVRTDDQTVRNWFKRSTAEGIEGLKDRPMPERPAKVTKAYKEQVLMAVRRRPRALGQAYSMWTYQRLADYLAEQTGLRVAYETVRRVLAAHGVVLSRPQHKVSSPDPEYLVKKDG
jgi:transposase